jgi:hypothetical protein
MSLAEVEAAVTHLADEGEGSSRASDTRRHIQLLGPTLDGVVHLAEAGFGGSQLSDDFGEAAEGRLALGICLLARAGAAGTVQRGVRSRVTAADAVDGGLKIAERQTLSFEEASSKRAFPGPAPGLGPLMALDLLGEARLFLRVRGRVLSYAG